MHFPTHTPDGAVFDTNIAKLLQLLAIAHNDERSYILLLLLVVVLFSGQRQTIFLHYMRPAASIPTGPRRLSRTSHAIGLFNVDEYSLDLCRASVADCVRQALLLLLLLKRPTEFSYWLLSDAKLRLWLRLRLLKMSFTHHLTQPRFHAGCRRNVTRQKLPFLGDV